MNSEPNSRISHKIKTAMPPVDELQIELAAFLQKRFQVTKVSSILAPSTQDFWAEYRWQHPESVPATKYDLHIAAENYDAKNLTPNDIKYIEDLAARYNFEFCYEPDDETSIFITGYFPMQEAFAELLVAMWKDPKPYTRLPKCPATRKELIEATKIFLRFIRSQNLEPKSPSNNKVCSLIGAMCRRIGGDILNNDKELAHLVT